MKDNDRKRPVQYVPGALYGFCPRCGAPGARRKLGRDTCQNNHDYPSTKALAKVNRPMMKHRHKRPYTKRAAYWTALVLAAALVFAPLSSHAGTVRYPTCTPPLPYSCTEVRWAVSVFSRAYLEEQGKKRGLTSCMRKQAKACIAGAP